MGHAKCLLVEIELGTVATIAVSDQLDMFSGTVAVLPPAEPTNAA
jgi:hypothetical protein